MLKPGSRDPVSGGHTWHSDGFFPGTELLKCALSNTRPPPTRCGTYSPFGGRGSQGRSRRRVFAGINSSSHYDPQADPYQWQWIPQYQHQLKMASCQQCHKTLSSLDPYVFNFLKDSVTSPEADIFCNSVKG